MLIAPFKASQSQSFCVRSRVIRRESAEMNRQHPINQILNTDFLTNKYCHNRNANDRIEDSSDILYNLISSCISGALLIKKGIPLNQLEFIRENSGIMQPPRTEFINSFHSLMNLYVKNKLSGNQLRRVVVFIGNEIEIKNLKETYVFEMKENHSRSTNESTDGESENSSNYSFRNESFKTFLELFLKNLYQLGRKTTYIVLQFQFIKEFDRPGSEEGQKMRVFQVKTYRSKRRHVKFETLSFNMPKLMEHLKPIASVHTPFQSLSVSQSINPQLCKIFHQHNLSVQILSSGLSIYSKNIDEARVKILLKLVKNENLKTIKRYFSTGF